jgi:hypothetical protein
MTPEKMPINFSEFSKAHEEANEIDAKVDRHYKNPRVDKLRPKNEVAAKKIKEIPSRPIDTRGMGDDEKKWIENMKNAGITFLSDGHLEIPRWEKNKKNNYEPELVLQKVDGLISAYRMQNNIIEKYRVGKEDKKSELEEIESMQEVIEHANGLLLMWRTVKPEERDELQMQLVEIVLRLEKCKNEFKVKVKDQAEAVSELKDSKDRENPGALAARTVSALSSLAKRINETQSIMPVMAMRKEIIFLEQRRIKGAVERSKAHLNGVLHHPVFNEGSKDKSGERINDNEVEELNRKIGKTLHQLGTIHVFPYLAQTEQAIFHLKYDIKKHFSSKEELVRNIDSVKKSLTNVLMILGEDIERLDQSKEKK